jgi:DNA-binding GntR family transcriptional regulator
MPHNGPPRTGRNAAPAKADQPWPVIGSSRTLAQRVYEVMRDRILANELSPLAYVREEELATAMMVSRTPIREALNRLATEGFLERLPHRGFRVARRSIEELAHVYTVLQSLELLACELAFPHITPADLARLEEANAGFATAIAANDVSTAVDLNDRFHHLFAELSGNPVLSRLLDDLRQQVHRLEVLDFSSVLLGSEDEDQTPISRDTWVKQHAEFIEALRAGDQRHALDIMRANRSFVFHKKVDQARAKAREAAGLDGSAVPGGKTPASSKRSGDARRKRVAGARGRRPGSR